MGAGEVGVIGILNYWIVFCTLTNFRVQDDLTLGYVTNDLHHALKYRDP